MTRIIGAAAIMLAAVVSLGCSPARAQSDPGMRMVVPEGDGGIVRKQKRPRYAHAGKRTRVASKPRHHSTRHAQKARPRASVKVAGGSGPLLSKVREIQAACGSRIVSGHRAGARTPSGKVSNHALGLAYDVQGNPGCIYAHLKGWPGGYSTDYASAPGGPHVHISYNPGGMEWGLRFAHRHGGSKRTRYARHYKTRHVRVASHSKYRREAIAQ